MALLTKEGVVLKISNPVDVDFYLRLGYVKVDPVEVNPDPNVAEEETPQRPQGRRKKRR